MADHPLRSATHRRLGEPLPHQLANGTRAHLCAIKSFTSSPCGVVALCGISSRFQLLSPSQRQVAHALLTRPLLRLYPKTKPPFNLHVLSTPPAFVLSQDQTLSLKLFQRFLANVNKLIASFSACPFVRAPLHKHSVLYSAVCYFQGPFSRTGLTRHGIVYHGY